jgi:hypothetical protein
MYNLKSKRAHCFKNKLEIIFGLLIIKHLKRIFLSKIEMYSFFVTLYSQIKNYFYIFTRKIVFRNAIINAGAIQDLNPE